MTRRNRASRAKNKIQGSNHGSLIKADPVSFTEASETVHRTNALAITKSTLLTAELEAVIEIIARERVYRAMLAGLGRHLLTSPTHPPTTPPVIAD